MIFMQSLLILFLLATTVGYPVNCSEIGISLLGMISDCDVLSDPLPFHWTSTITLKKNVKWAGIDDVSYLYSNSDETLKANCTLAAPLPGNYNQGVNLTIEQTCFKFTPQLVKGAKLLATFFQTHQERFSDVLVYNYPIPGYINLDEPQRPQEVTGEEKERVWRWIGRGQL
jgi:hypothetical protein